MRFNASVIRRSLRLLHAIDILQQRGYQNLGIFPSLSDCGFQWELWLLPVYSLFITPLGRLSFYQIDEQLLARHSSGSSGNEYFGWADCKGHTAEQLADAIEHRFTKLMTFCRGSNPHYLNWFSAMLNFARRDALPVASRKDTEMPHNGLSSTLQNVDIPLPDVPISFKLKGRQYVQRIYHKTEWPTPDWHEAYQSIVDTVVSGKNFVLPSMPDNSADLFEMGAYWEGAVYWLHEHLRVYSFIEYLDLLESTERYDSGDLFMQVFNNQGQLQYLTAFLAKRQLVAKRFNNSSQEQYWSQWLKNFEQHTQYSKLRELDNPYFGGDNPLHLGLGLQRVRQATSLLI